MPAQGLALLESRASSARVLSPSRLPEMPPEKGSGAVGLGEAGNNLPSRVFRQQERYVLGKADIVRL